MVAIIRKCIIYIILYGRKVRFSRQTHHAKRQRLLNGDFLVGLDSLDVLVSLQGGDGIGGVADAVDVENVLAC